MEIVHHFEDVVSLALGLITRAREGTLLELELRFQCGHLRRKSLDLPGYECVDSVSTLYLVVEGCPEISEHPLDANLYKFERMETLDEVARWGLDHDPPQQYGLRYPHFYSSSAARPFSPVGCGVSISCFSALRWT